MVIVTVITIVIVIQCDGDSDFDVIMIVIELILIDCSLHVQYRLNIIYTNINGFKEITNIE